MARATVAATGSYLNLDLLVLGVALSSSGVSPEKLVYLAESLMRSRTHYPIHLHDVFDVAATTLPVIAPPSTFAIV
ncbi:hypothetical protein EYR41_010239 [Orbilia oligospora]|uniref:Uncharacterized protein n=1 Tax=Orbilia oligospora TaxID=2813651 RepID=A0A8H2HES6_ORBOL|nr:hypothetical protein EYR41_010239 [Orbilia oligospora]